MYPRTDLALEIKESYEDDVEIKGVVFEEKIDKENSIKVTNVIIKDKHGEKAMNKPIGRYITIESSMLDEEDENFHISLKNEIEKNINELTNGGKDRKILIAGLGNRDITPDSLGALVVDNLFVTRHLIREYGQEFKNNNDIENISAIAPGVMAQTGMETREIIKGIVEETKADLVIVVDALAARSTDRLNKTIQLTDTGISPGSGVGNNRNAINKESLGVEVVAIGVPTVVDAATIVNDQLEKFLNKQGLEHEETKNFMDDIKKSMVNNMIVTPRNIDESVKRISYTISEALNSCYSIIL